MNHICFISVLDSLERQVKCVKCENFYASKDSLRKHLKKTSCGTPFQIHDTHREHILTHATDLQRNCMTLAHSDYVFPKWDSKDIISFMEFYLHFPNSIPHLKNYNSKKVWRQTDLFTYACQICNKKFLDSNMLLEVEPTKRSALILQCGKCDQCFSIFNELLRHMLLTHEGYAFICGVKSCKKVYSNVGILKRHLKLKHRIFHNHWQLKQIFY